MCGVKDRGEEDADGGVGDAAVRRRETANLAATERADGGAELPSVAARGEDATNLTVCAKSLGAAASGTMIEDVHSGSRSEEFKMHATIAAALSRISSSSSLSAVKIV